MNAKKIVAQFKRELWENRIGFLWAPLVFSGLLFLVAMWSIGKNITIHANSNVPLNPDDPGAMAVMTMMYQVASSAIYLVSFAVVILVYAHSTLFSDRKSREILFWRSMPVSETTNVLTKLAMICLVVPLIIFVGALVGGFLFALCLFIVNPEMSGFMRALKELSVSVELLRSCFVVVVLMLPIITWSLFFSAFARRSPVTISISIPLVLWVVDSLAQKYLGIGLLFKDALDAYARLTASTFKKMMSHSSQSLAEVDLFSSADVPVVSVLLLFSVVMIGFAIWLRNHRYEI